MRFSPCTLVLLPCTLTLFACASPSPDATAPRDTADAPAPAAYAIDAARLESADPIRADSATLYVNGLGCPLCATNVDKQIERIAGVSVLSVDLSEGIVRVAMAGKGRPSPHDFHAAVEDAGFTLVRIEAP